MNEIFEENGKQYLARPVISHDDVLSDAIDKCLDLMYRASYPSITLEEYKNQYKGMETEKEKRESKLYESHYLPWKAYKAIEEDFVEAYELKPQLPEIIDILKGYFKKPIVDKWIDGKDGNPGHRGYEHPEPMDEETYEKVCKFLDMANGFYSWNRDINTFYFNISNYSPCSNRETVEKWWHEHGDPDFKLPEGSWWTDTWDEVEEEDEENEENNTTDGGIMSIKRVSLEDDQL